MEYSPFEPSSVPYYDNERFPLGFRRSGDFNVSEADILHRYGLSLRALETGERIALTDEERSFIDVCEGRKVAQTDIEKAWLKYRLLLGAKNTVSAFGRSRVSVITEYADDADDADDSDVDGDEDI